MDLAAQTNEGLTQWMEDSQLLEVAAEIGLNFRYWHVMDSGRDSVDLLKRLLDRHGTHLNYTLVLNQIRGDDFRILDASGEKERTGRVSLRKFWMRRARRLLPAPRPRAPVSLRSPGSRARCGCARRR